MDRRCAELNLVRLPFRASYFIDQSREVGMAEVTLPPDSTLLGKSVLSWASVRSTGSTWSACVATTKRSPTACWKRSCAWAIPCW